METEVDYCLCRGINLALIDNIHGTALFSLLQPRE